MRTTRLQNQWSGVRILPLLPLLGTKRPSVNPEGLWFLGFADILNVYGYQRLKNPAWFEGFFKSDLCLFL